MYKSIFAFLLVVLFQSGLMAQEDSTNILFIGNSITYFNQMPQTVKAIAEQKGHPTNVTMHAPGGTGFIHHVENPTVYNYIKQGNWDFVILQPGSSESAGVSQTKEQTLVRAKILNDSIAKYNPCAKVLYYQISNGVWGNTPENITTYNEVMDNIKTNVEFWADETSSAFAPAGEAMRAAWNNDSNTLLWGSTGDIHPNQKGSYLIACTIFASIFQEPSFGADVIVPTMTTTERDYYQNLADEKVLNHFADWRINTYHQHADFSYQMTDNGVQFTNLSANSSAYHWDFGDGTTSTEEHPLHLYPENGNYQVVLTTSNGDCEEKVMKDITYTLSVSEVEAVKISVYPNPFINKIWLEGKEMDISELMIYNAVGQVLKTNLTQLDDNKFQLDTTDFSKGVYYLKFNETVYKLIKE